MVFLKTWGLKIMVDDTELIGLPKRDLYRIHEVANYFAVSQANIRTLIQHGQLEIEKEKEKLRGTVWVTRISIIRFRERNRQY